MFWGILCDTNLGVTALGRGLYARELCSYSSVPLHNIHNFRYLARQWHAKKLKGRKLKMKYSFQHFKQS